MNRIAAILALAAFVAVSNQDYRDAQLVHSTLNPDAPLVRVVKK